MGPRMVGTHRALLSEHMALGSKILAGLALCGALGVTRGVVSVCMPPRVVYTGVTVAVEVPSAIQHSDSTVTATVPYQVTSGFGKRRNPITGRSEIHPGIDVSMPRGTPLYAPCECKVVKVGNSRTAGRYVRLSDVSDNVTTMMHLDRVYATQGSNVGPGDMIALSGASGEVTGPHLHLETTDRGLVVDPTSILSRVVTTTTVR